MYERDASMSAFAWPSVSLTRRPVYENPLLIATRRTTIANQFAMLRLLPGELWSEMEEIFEAEDFRAYSGLLTL